MVGVAYCAPEAFNDEDFDDSDQQDEAMYDDDEGGDDDDDDNEGDNDEGGDDIRQRSTDVENDNTSGTVTGSVDGEDTATAPTNRVKNEGECSKTTGLDQKCNSCGKSGVPCDGNGCRKRLQKSRCGKVHSPKHGGIRLSGRYVKYYCHHGYKLQGAALNRCVYTHGKHQWYHRTPECKRTYHR